MMLEEKQKAYVKDSLTRAIRGMKVAKIEGRKLQSVDDFINDKLYTLLPEFWEDDE